MITKETIVLVKNYYNEDDISRVLPGKKDFISCLVVGVRTQVQKRLLLGNIRELHALFKEKYPQIKLSTTKFSEI